MSYLDIETSIHQLDHVCHYLVLPVLISVSYLHQYPDHYLAICNSKKFLLLMIEIDFYFVRFVVNWARFGVQKWSNLITKANRPESKFVHNMSFYIMIMPTIDPNAVYCMQIRMYNFTEERILCIHWGVWSWVRPSLCI